MFSVMVKIFSISIEATKKSKIVEILRDLNSNKKEAQMMSRDLYIGKTFKLRN